MFKTVYVKPEPKMSVSRFRGMRFELMSPLCAHVNSLVAAAAGTVHGKQYFDPSMRQGANRGVVAMAAVPLLVVEGSRPRAAMSRLVGEELECSRRELSTAPAKSERSADRPAAMTCGRDETSQGTSPAGHSRLHRS